MTLTSSVIKPDMALTSASVNYVYQRLTIYYNSCVDLKWRRAIHCCEVCHIQHVLGEPCGAIHRGYCTGLPSKPPPSPVQDYSKRNGLAESPLEDREKRTHVNNHQSEPTTDDSNLNNNNTVPGRKPRKSATPSPTPTPRESREKDARGLPGAPGASRAGVHIPPFYYPMGKPPSQDEKDAILLRVSDCFNDLDGGKAYKHQMGTVAKAAGCAFYWRAPLYLACGGDQTGYVTLQSFTQMWTRLTQSCHDAASRFVHLLAKPGTMYMVADDFVPIIQDIVDSHPGLAFLQDAPEFHSRYVHTVIARIFYCVNRSWTGRITVPELRKSNLLEVIGSLQDEEDINQVTEYFSYEHFYVIYCKFWELDKDHDLFISKDDLSRHNEHSISSRMIDRIFSGAVTRGKAQSEGKMSYPEFVWFLISEEDKKQPTSIEYWFRCMDIDGDGYISMYEMEYFYEEQTQRMEALGIETLPFEDIVCQMMDMVKPSNMTCISRADLRACKMTDIFFDTFFNLEKYLDHEQRDPFSNQRDVDTEVPELSDWEKYAAEEYEILVAEEGANQMDDDINYEDDFEAEDEEELVALEPDEFKSAKNNSQPAGAPALARF